MSTELEFLAVKALRDEVQRGGANEIYKLTTPAQRIALDRRYQVLAEFLLERIYLNDTMLQGTPR